MKENQKKSFDFASDTTKQLITLATAIIALTVTFSKEIIGINDSLPKILLVWTWGIFILSIVFGILTLMALTGTLQPISKENKKEKQNAQNDNPSNHTILITDNDLDITINKGNIRRFSIIQISLFIIALVLTAVYGYKSLSTKKRDNSLKNTYMIIRESKLGLDTTTYIDTLYLPK